MRTRVLRTRVLRTRVLRTRVLRTRVRRTRVRRTRVLRTRVRRTRVLRTRVRRTRVLRTRVLRTRVPRTRAVALRLTAVLLVAAALAACNGSPDKPAAKTLTAAQQLAAARAKADAATSIHLTLRSSGIPDSANGVLGVDGSGTHAPAFKGTLQGRISGITTKVQVVALDTLLYAKLPFGIGFTKIDPKKYHAPDPAQLFATDGGITSFMTTTTNPVEGAKARAGNEVLKTITGKLPGDRVVRLLSIGDAAKTFDVTYGLTDPGGELRRVSVTGPFYQGATSTYTLTLDRYGAPVEIRKP